MTELSLAAEFPALTQADWMKRVEAVLKGASFEEKLVHTTSDGIRLEPLYGQMAGPRAERPELAPWTLFQRVDHPDPAKANSQAMDDLRGGATGLVLVEKGSPTARGFGVDFAELPRMLNGVELHAVALRIDGSFEAARALAKFISTRPVDPERLNVSWGHNHVGVALDLIASGFSGAMLEADGRVWHEQGATPAQELGAVLAQTTLNLEAADYPALSITLAADQDMFGTLAKFRAMRLLWARMLEYCDFEVPTLVLHAETSFRMMGSLDPHINILRSVAAVFGAGLGGADSISVLPFSLTQGLPNSFARRVARNVQTVLLEESNLWRVADPASGSGYVEHLTNELCAKAWRIFQKAMHMDPSDNGHDSKKEGAADRAFGWPKPVAANPASLPVIGTRVYRLPTEYSAEVEKLP